MELRAGAGVGGVESGPMLVGGVGGGGLRIRRNQQHHHQNGGAHLGEPKFSALGP